MVAPGAELECRDVDGARWADLERLFEGRGGPAYCWCMLWRPMTAAARRGGGKEARKRALRRLVDAGVPVGLLGYRDGEPMAWCSVAPRESYRAMGGPGDFADDANAVWSIGCFFVRRDHRRGGLSERLLAAAVERARKAGARVVEAYPVAPDSPSYRFMGLTTVFERASFADLGMVGKRRHLMRLEISWSRPAGPPLAVPQPAAASARSRTSRE